MPTFGEKLHTLRKRDSLTTRQMAEILSTSHGYITDLEKGRRQPSLELARRVADYFTVSVDQLAKDELDVE